MNQILATELDSNKWIVYRPLHGAKLSENKEVILGKFRILEKKKLRSIISKTYNSDDFYSDVEKHLLNRYQLFIGVEVNMGEGKVALEKANYHFHQFDNIVRYMLKYFKNIDISVFEYSEPELLQAICLTPQKWFWSSSWEGATEIVSLDTSSFYQDLTNSSLGYDWIWNTVAKPNVNNLEKRIVSAIEWLGKSARDSSISRAYVQVVLALEALFLLQEKNVLVNPSIANQLAESSAFILGSDYSSRCKIEKQVKDVYAKRSSIVHGGDAEVCKDDYDQAFSLLWHLIIKLTTDSSFNFSSIEKLSEWVKQQKYA